jgi:predicted N-acetyltransferase YhbS/acyl carrier protein
VTRELRTLDREAAPAFEGVILRPLRASPGDARCVAVGALVDGQPAGAAVATLTTDGARAGLGSLVVARERRGQGVGAALVAEVERLLVARGGARADPAPRARQALRARPHAPARAARVRGPRRRPRDIQVSAEAMARLPWLATARLPAGFACAPLAQVTPDERDALRAAGWFEADWDPFAAAEHHRERTYQDLVLRQGGDVVGWILCARVEPDTLLWHTLLVRHDLQGTGVGLALCAEALGRAMGDPAVRRHVLTVHETNGSMLALVAAALAPHVPPPSKLHGWRKALPRPVPAAPGFASLSALLRARAAERPGRETFTYLDDGTWDGPRRTLSPGELDRRARATAALLQGRCRPGDRAAPDEVGEVWVRGGGVCPGYFGRAAAPAFEGRLSGEPRPFLRTGDLGFLRGEALFVVGRRDDVLVVRGRNHHPQDLEATLEGVHPALRPHGAAAVGVVAANDELELAVVAEVERAAARSVDAAAVAGAARAALADAHGLDLRRLVLVLPGALPRTSSGKTQRRATRDLLARGALERVLGEWRATHDAALEADATGSPRTQALEAWLAARLDERGLALDSLAALQLLSALEDHLQVRLPPALLAGAPTPAALARALEAELERAHDARRRRGQHAS